MTREEAIAILENEKKCVNRANKNNYCNRDCYNCELVKTDTEILNAFDMAIKALEQEPCEDATLKDIFCMGCEYKEQEPKIGRWIDRFPAKECKCSVCDFLICISNGSYIDMVGQMKYCPNCGAKMEEVEEWN